MKKEFRFLISILFLSPVIFLSGCKSESESDKLVYEGSIKFENADFAGAEKTFMKAIKNYPDNLKGYFKLASARVCSKPDISFFDELMWITKEKSYPHNLLEIPVAFRGGRYSEDIINTYEERKEKLLNISDEISAFTAAIKKNPDNAKLYRGRGEWCFLLGDKREALNDFTKATQLDNNFDMAFLMRARWYTRGFVNYAEHNYVDFYEYDLKNKYNIRRAFQINPKNILVQTELYAIYIKDKVSLEEQLKLLSQIVVTDSTNVGALRNRAWLKKQAKDNKGALQDFMQLVKKIPTDSWHRDALGTQELEMGMIKAGLKDLEIAKTLSTYPNQKKWIQEKIDKYSKRKK